MTLNRSTKTEKEVIDYQIDLAIAYKQRLLKRIENGEHSETILNSLGKICGTIDKLFCKLHNLS